MGRRRRDLPAARVAAVRRRIEHWRRVREKRSPMPEELWTAAVSLAREHGLYRVVRALGVNYETLKARAGRLASDGAEAANGCGGFVELNGGHLVGRSPGAGSVVELSGADGAKLTIRLAGDAPELLGLVQAFWRRHA